MKRCLLLLIASSFLYGAKNPVVKEQTFLYLNGKYDEVVKKTHRFHKMSKKMLDLFEHNYDEKVGLLHDGFSKAKIPHVIHFIWQGQDPLSCTIIENLDSWRNYHPGWKIKLWTDIHCRTCPVPGIEVIQTSELSPLFALKILFEEGGVFVDSSFFCYRAFDCLSCFDFYACLEHKHFFKSSREDIFPSLALFAAKPSHPIVGRTLELATSHEIHQAFLIACRKALDHKGNRDMILPSCYFFADKLFQHGTFSYLLKNGFVFACKKR
jgi:mannosyltransferase OCH1-like enzyme